MKHFIGIILTLLLVWVIVAIFNLEGDLARDHLVIVGLLAYLIMQVGRLEKKGGKT